MVGKPAAARAAARCANVYTQVFNQNISRPKRQFRPKIISNWVGTGKQTGKTLGLLIKSFVSERENETSSTPVLGSNSYMFQNAPCGLVGPASTWPLHVATPVVAHRPCRYLLMSRLAWPPTHPLGNCYRLERIGTRFFWVLLATPTPFLPKFPASLCCTSTSVPETQTTTLNGLRFQADGFC